MIKRTICIENPCHLKCPDAQLVVSYDHVKGYEGMPEKSVPIEDIGMLILEHHQITLTHYLIDKLLANNASIVTCTENKLPSGMMLSLEGNTLQLAYFILFVSVTSRSVKHVVACPPKNFPTTRFPAPELLGYIF